MEATLTRTGTDALPYDSAAIEFDSETPGLVDAVTQLGDGPKRAFRKLWDAVQFDAWQSGADGRRFKTLPTAINFTSLANALGKSEPQTRRDLNALESTGLVLQARHKNRTVTPTLYDPRQVLVAEINALQVAAGEYQPTLPGVEKGAAIRLFRPEAFANLRANMRTPTAEDREAFSHLRTDQAPFAKMRADMRTATQEEQRGVVRDVLAHLTSAHARPIPRKQENLSNHQSPAQQPSTRKPSIPAPGELDRIAAKIELAIDDPDMDSWIPERLAWAVVEGLVTHRRLRNMIRYIEHKRSAGEVQSPGAYLNGMGKNLARKCRFAWCPLGDRRQRE